MTDDGMTENTDDGMTENGGMTVGELLRRAMLPRELAPVFEKLRLETWNIVQNVFNDRAASYDRDRPCYESLAFGPITIVDKQYDKIWRLAQLLSPTRAERLRDADINRILDSCIDLMNYSSWLYALVVIASGYENHIDSDDAPDYTGKRSAATREDVRKADEARERQWEMQEGLDGQQ